MRPLSSAYLAWQNLKRKPFRSCCLVFIVALFAFSLFAGSIFNQSLSMGMQSLAGRLGADIMVVPYGYNKDLQVALLRGEPSGFYLKAELKDKLSGLPGVKGVSPQLFLASLDAGCCSAKVQLIGFDPATDFIVRPWLQEMPGQQLKDDQVIVGSRIITGVGQDVEFFSHKFKVAARMDRTGMGFDTSVFMTLPAAYNLLLQSGMLSGDVRAIKQFASSLLVKVDSGHEPRDVANAIMQNFAIDYNLDFLLTKSMVSDLGEKLDNIALFIFILAAFLWLMAAVVLFIVFSSTTNERKRELSILRILGASRGMLVKLIMQEALFIGIGGAFGGVIAASAFIFPFSALIFNALGLPYLQPGWPAIIGYLLLTMGIAALVGPLANIYTALNISKNDTYTTMREGE